MGHLINPISTRLGLTSFWVSNWNYYLINNFSYTLMLDNILYKFILWLFSESSVAVHLSTVGVFLSHFKIIKRGKRVSIFVFLISKSIDFLKSQKIEADPSIFIFENELIGVSIFKHLFNSNDNNTLGFRRNYTLFNFVRNSFIHFSFDFFSSIFNRFFKLNFSFNHYTASLNLSFLKGINFLNPRFLSRFISRRLSFGFSLNKVLNPIVSDLVKLIESSNSKIIGFKISCNGRFNKTQMASYTWEKYGPVPLNKFSCSVDYSFSKVFMKYGLCGIKVYIFTVHNVFKSFKSTVLKTIIHSTVFSKLVSFKKNLFLFLWLKLVCRFFLLEKSSNSFKEFDDFSLFLSFLIDSVVILKRI